MEAVACFRQPSRWPHCALREVECTDSHDGYEPMSGRRLVVCMPAASASAMGGSSRCPSRSIWKTYVHGFSGRGRLSTFVRLIWRRANSPRMSCSAPATLRTPKLSDVRNCSFFAGLRLYSAFDRATNRVVLFSRLWMERWITARSEEHTSELQSPCNLVCRLLLEKKTTLHRRLLRLH